MTMNVLSPVIGALLLVSTATPAFSEVRLFHGNGGSYQVRVMSWRDIPFRSVVRQRHDFSCGSAAVATLLTYHYGLPTAERDPFALMWSQGNQEVIRKEGFSMLDMKRFLDAAGYRANGYRLTVEQLGGIRKPGIVLMNVQGYKHFVVLKGVASGRVLVGDPMLGLRAYSLSDFAKAWNNIILTVVEPPSDAAPAFNLASDWGPWSKAPTRQAAAALTVTALTNSLPFSWQISDQLLLSVRVGTVSR